MHDCKHEVDFAVMQKDISSISDDMKDIKRRLVGNGKEGLVTRVSNLEQRNEQMPTPRGLMFYSTVGGGIVLFVTLLGRWALTQIGV